MPPAVAAAVMAGSAAAGTGASIAGGKKANNRANQQLQLQQQQLQFGRDLANKAISTAWTPAANYWTALLKGGPAATTAVGPYAGQLRTQGTGELNALNSALPAGGEKNLARAGVISNTYTGIQRLTAGVQPMAATALSSLASPLLGEGTSTMGQGVSLTPSLLNFATNQANATQQGASGFGNLLYNAINKPQNGTNLGPPLTVGDMGVNPSVLLGGMGIPGAGARI